MDAIDHAAPPSAPSVLPSPSLSRGAWAVIWKGDGRSVRDFLLSFGLSSSPEAAMAKVELRLAGDDRFRRKSAGGVFYPVAVHINLAVPVGRW